MRIRLTAVVIPEDDRKTGTGGINAFIRAKKEYRMDDKGRGTTGRKHLNWMHLLRATQRSKGQRG